MKILYIHQYFKTPNEPGGTRSYWMAKELLANGHNVTMLTTRPSGQNSGETDVVDVEGIKVIYSNVKYNQSMSILQRLKSFANFMVQATKLGWKEKDVDLVIATSTPLTVGVPALMLKWLKKKPYIFEVRDLWPDVPIQMGGLNNPILITLAQWFERTIYRNAEHVIALSPGMQDGVAKYIPAERTSMIPNMAKVEQFFPRQKSWRIMDKLGVSKETFKVIHFGALGLANGAEYIVEVANHLRDYTHVEFIFLGTGSTESVLRNQCEELQLDNVKFLGEYPMEATSEIVNCCDVSMVSFKDIPILYTNSPNKLFDSLSAGKPVIVNSAGWTKDLVQNYDCGYYVSPKHPQELAELVLYLVSHPEEVLKKGENARMLAENKFDKSILSKQFVDVVNMFV